MRLGKKTGDSRAGLVSLFRQELEFCAVCPDEPVEIFTQGRMRLDYAAAVIAAALDRDCVVAPPIAALGRVSSALETSRMGVRG